MDWTQIITLGIAILGACTGVYGATLSTLVYRRGHRRVRVTYGFDESLRPEAQRLWCELVNPGAVPAFVKSIRFVMAVDGRAKETPLFGDAKLEAKLLGSLDPGASKRVLAPASYEPFLAGKLERAIVTTGDDKRIVFAGSQLQRLKLKVRAALAREANAG